MDYKEILKGIVNIINTTEKSDIGFANICNYIGENCPELKESEDERLRKTTIAFLKEFADKGYENAVECIAWLEKQGEQKPVISDGALREGIAHFGITQYQIDKWLKKYIDVKKQGETIDNTDKVEPKFKVGNWYQCTKDFFGKGVTFDKNTAYYCAKEGCLQNEYGCHIAIVKDLYDNFKLWTIADAKDGDFLYVSTEKMSYWAIFKDIEYNNLRFHGFSLELFHLGGCVAISDIKKINPLPIEPHRKGFIERIHKAGYEWDSEDKELKKIESKTLDPDEVIEWLIRYMPIFWDTPCNPQQIVEQFKEDFGL